MLIVHVRVEVKPEFVDVFKEATFANARESVKELGVARFDVLQYEDPPNVFVLQEAYRSDDAQAAHRKTAHYLAWRDTVAPMMAVPRASVRLRNLFPGDAAW